MTWLHMMPCVASCHIICVTSGHIKSQYTLSIHVMTCDMWHHVTSCHFVTSRDIMLCVTSRHIKLHLVKSHDICDVWHHVTSCHLWHRVTSCHILPCVTSPHCKSYSFWSLQIASFEHPVKVKTAPCDNCTSGKMPLVLAEGNLKQELSAQKHKIFSKERVSSEGKLGKEPSVEKFDICTKWRKPCD